MQWKPVAIACTIAVLGFVVAVSSNISGACRQHVVTFDRSVTLPGVVLPAGEYAFQVSDMPDLVVVRSADCRETYYVGFTTTVARPKGGASPVALGEASAGEPTPVMAWHPDGDPAGHQFRY
jgi:hypothetical protein